MKPRGVFRRAVLPYEAQGLQCTTKLWTFTALIWYSKLMNAQKTILKINSLAAPSAEDAAALRALNEVQMRKLVAEHIAAGSKDIAEGRSTTLKSDEDIHEFFDEIWPVE